MDSLRRLLNHPGTIRACQIGIGLVFAVAGLAKIGNPAAFADDIHNFRMVPVALENLVALALPWIEIVAAVALVLGVRARPAAHRTICCDETGAATAAAVYQRDALGPGDTLTGPALIVEPQTSTLVGTGFNVTVDSGLNIVLTLEEVQP